MSDTISNRGIRPIRDYVAELSRVEPRSRVVLEMLADWGVLANISPDDDVPAAGILLRILRQPRHPLFTARQVYWSLLERLANPASTTQKISIPFDNGEN